jgi:hypothetical protein
MLRYDSNEIPGPYLPEYTSLINTPHDAQNPFPEIYVPPADARGPKRLRIYGWVVEPSSADVCFHRSWGLSHNGLL